MATWEDVISFGKLGELTIPIARRSLSGGRDFGRTRIVGRPGQETDDTGRKPLVFRLQIPAFEGIEGFRFPEDYESLLAIVTGEADGGTIDYQDPILGSFQVQIVDFDFDETAMSRDGAMVSLSLEENTAEALGRYVLDVATPASRSAALDLAEDVDDGLADLGVSDDEIEGAFADAGVPLAADEGRTFFERTDTIFAAIDSVAFRAEEIAQEINRYSARLDALVTLDTFESSGAASVYQSAKRLRATTRRAAAARVDDRRKLRTITTAGVTSAHGLAAKLYGDPARAAEIVSLNDFRDPNRIPAGSLVRVYVA